MSEPPTFETDRLSLRPFTKDDIDAFAAVFENKEAMWDVLAIPDMPTDSRAVAEHRIEESVSGWAAHDAGFWAVAIRSADLGRVGRIIGYCGFVNPAKSAVEERSESVLEVGWGIHPALQRRGAGDPGDGAGVGLCLQSAANRAARGDYRPAEPGVLCF